MGISYNPLWDLLSYRNIKQKELWKQAHISASTCQKLRNNENVTTDILARICNALHCDLSDIATCQENTCKRGKEIMSYKVIDLFCGAGGLSLGFQQAHFDILAGVDSNIPALSTYRQNMKGALALDEDLFDAEGSLEHIRKELHSVNIDVIIAGPPCQGFSLTGARDLDDTRNKLYLAVVKAVEYFQPKAFLIENVPGMATLYKGVVKKQIINTFEDLGYAVSVTPKPLLAADYGVPQMRKRMFFVGFKKSLGYDYFDFPRPKLSSENYVTCGEAISDLPSLEKNLGTEVSNYQKKPQSNYQKFLRRNSKQIFNHVATKHTDYVKWVISQVPEGGNYKNLPQGVGDTRKFNEAWTRYDSHKPSRTIDTGHRNHFHYKWNRVPTVRENARLQSFPDEFKFLGTKTQQNRQVGNAVPPLLAQAIAEKMYQHLEGDTTHHTHHYAKKQLDLGI